MRARTTGGGAPAETLVSRPSVVPGPSYPFPSETLLGKKPTGLHGFAQSVLKPFRRARVRARQYTFLDWLQVFLPCVRWLRTYKIKEYLLWDIIAGISVGFMVVPQGMSYANIAGVPSVYGLYGAFLPVLVYAVFGSSKELAVGPVAVTSLLISSSLKEVVPGSVDITNPNNPPAELVAVQQMYNTRAIQLSLLVACMYTAVGVFNLGFLTNFLSHSVIGGFTSGAAIIIGLSQLKYILGYNVPRADKLHEQLELYIHGIQGFVWQEYVMGMTLLTMLLTIKYFGKRYPRLKWLRPLGPISACVVAIIAVVAGNLQDKGIKIVGHIPAGLPGPTVGLWLPMEDAARLAPLALVVMVVDLLESTSIARALAAKGKYELSANQEIVGLGLANFAGSAFNAYSTTGSFSRSAVNYDSGCKTGLAGLVTGCVVGLVLLVLTPVFEKLPLNVMGAIVISGVSGLFEYEEAVHLFKVRKLDWCVWMCSFLSTMFLGVEIGLAISIGLALLIVIYESAFPHTALLGRVGRTTIYRNVKQFPDSQVIPGIAACRVDAAMYFANVAYIHERLRKYVARAEAYSEAAGTRLQYVLLDMSPVTHLDTTGATLLEKLYDELQQQGVQLGLCNPGCNVVALLERTGFPDLMGREWIFVRMHDAVQTCLAAMISDGQAVRPLSAYDTAVTPRLSTLPGPSPLLFRPPGRRSPDDSFVRWSAPGTGGLAGTLHPRAGGGFSLTRGRRSLDETGSGTSPLLPQKGVADSNGLGLSPLLPMYTTSGAFSDKIGTGASAAPEHHPGPADAHAAAARRYLSDGGALSNASFGNWVRPESAPGFRSKDAAASPDLMQPNGHGNGDVSAQLPGAGLHTQQQAGLLRSQQQQQHHPDAEQYARLWAASAAVTAAAAASAGHEPPLSSSGRQSSSAAVAAPAHTDFAAPAGPQLTAAQDTSAPLPVALPRQQHHQQQQQVQPSSLPLLRVSSSGQRSVDGGSGCSLAPPSCASGPLLPPVNLGGLQLHISPAVLNHPAVLSRTQSLSGASGTGDGEGCGGSGGGGLAPLSSSSSFRRPVSPRTERLLNDVFSASNGDEEFLAADMGVSGQHGAMLQLTELHGDEHNGLGPLNHGHAAAGGTEAAMQVGEVRLLLGDPAGNTRQHQS